MICPEDGLYQGNKVDRWKIAHSKPIFPAGDRVPGVFSRFARSKPIWQRAQGTWRREPARSAVALRCLKARLHWRWEFPARRGCGAGSLHVRSRFGYGRRRFPRAFFAFCTLEANLAEGSGNVAERTGSVGCGVAVFEGAVTLALGVSRAKRVRCGQFAHSKPIWLRETEFWGRLSRFCTVEANSEDGSGSDAGRTGCRVGFMAGSAPAMEGFEAGRWKLFRRLALRAAEAAKGDGEGNGLGSLFRPKSSSEEREKSRLPVGRQKVSCLVSWVWRYL